MNITFPFIRNNNAKYSQQNEKLKNQVRFLAPPFRTCLSKLVGGGWEASVYWGCYEIQPARKYNFAERLLSDIYLNGNWKINSKEGYLVAKCFKGDLYVSGAAGTKKGFKGVTVAAKKAFCRSSISWWTFKMKFVSPGNRKIILY